MNRLSQATLADEAQLLLEAMRARKPVPPSRERIPELTIDGAYDVQRALIRLRAADGARRIGRKVGLTSVAMQEMLGVDQPDYGVLLDDMVLDSTEDIDRSQLIAPRVEAEIAFVLDRPLAGDHVGVDDVLAATGAVRPALEVIDSRVADWRIAIEDTIADNASSGLVIFGPPRPLDDVDLVGERATVTVGRDSVSGSGEAVLGHPAEGVAWLVRTLARHGEGVGAGEIVIPGAMAKALPFDAGDVVRASFSTLGELVVSVR
ncbi:MAG: fumarylacetoacetate hydrolase family protein [Solirubrobacterales bacterium]|nr:fumarylacetoacetate hydrolase family protein [Solirubrobacterales bacterium]